MYGEVLECSDLTNGRMTLRPPRQSELLYLLYRLCGKWAHPWLAVGGPLGLLREAFKTLRNPNDQTSHEWVIADESGVMVGMVMIDMIEPDTKRGRLSYAVFPEHQRRGYASRAATRVVGYGYTQLSLHEIWTRVLRKNEGSNKVLNGLGIIIDKSQVTYYVERGQAYAQDYGVIPRQKGLESV